MTTVVHCRKENYDVYIGRPSKWGNPFTIGADGTREEVIEKYEEWLLGARQAPNNKLTPSLSEAKAELKDKVLGCWCKPLACHGDVLAMILDKKDNWRNL